MPSDYTHLHFGRKIMDVLPERFLEAVKGNRELFEIGLQGPDILFFYKPLKKCPVNRTGYAMHEVSARDFFLPARDALNAAENQPAALAYLAGFLGHYALDTICHGYIENKIAVSGRTHSEIEKEFDSYLADIDFQKDAELDSAKSIVASRKNAEIISAFFPTVSPKQVRKSLQSMKLLTNLLSGKGFRRPLVTFALKISGQYEKLHDMLRPRYPIVGCEDSNLRLEKLMEKAVGFYKRLACDYENFLNGKAFPEGLTRTFGPGDHWQDIPVLTLEEEKTYEV